MHEDPYMYIIRKKYVAGSHYILNVTCDRHESLAQNIKIYYSKFKSAPSGTMNFSINKRIK